MGEEKNITQKPKSHSAENSPQGAKKRKREMSNSLYRQTNMWKKLKDVKTAVKEAMKKKEENQEELVKMEEKMVEELDKEYKDKLAALTLALEKEKQEKRSEIAEKVKVEQKRQAAVDQGILDELEKQQKTAEAEMMAEMCKKWPLYCPQGSGTLRQQL